MNHKIPAIAALCLLFVSQAFAQLGPGGVSKENAGQSTCRIWLDASTLTSLADGDDLTNWPDVSPSAINDVATTPPLPALPPFFRDDAAFAINGFPVVTFEEGRFLRLVTTSDLNAQTVAKTKSVFFAFRTSSDITSRQVIYEEGGTVRGYNVIIEDGEIIIGAYDFNVDNDDGINNGPIGNTPKWGYTYVSESISPNSTYILSTQFYAADFGVVDNDPDDYYIRGWLNGAVINNVTLGPNHQTGGNAFTNMGIGTLYNHPDPIGLGAVNSDMVDKNQIHNNRTGNFPFQGKLAEVCYYNDLLTQTERIIIQNYLGAKYFANIIADDKYVHEAGYGADVIGVGQQTNIPDNSHDQSRGRNPFRITASVPSTASNTYLMTGHNRAPMTWTANGVPGNSPNIQRLSRIWRIDEMGTNLGAISTRLYGDVLPPQPTGFTNARMVLLVDATSANFPNFTLPSTQVLEMTPSGTEYNIAYDFPDNAFYTFAWVIPTVQFAVSELFAIEGNPAPSSVTYPIELQLNFTLRNTTGNTLTVDYNYIPNTALLTDDYLYNTVAQAAGVTFAPGTNSATIELQVVNDIIEEDPGSENLSIELEIGSNTTPGLQIGTRNTLVFNIFDNDSPPKVGFSLAGSTVNEAAGTATIAIVRTTATGTGTATISRVASPNEGTATYGLDYECTSAGWFGSDENRSILVTFNNGEFSKVITVNLIDDEIDEFDETIEFQLFPGTGLAADPAGNLTHTLTIEDDDPEPEAFWLTPTQTGFEVVGSPVIFCELDRPSAKEVTVQFNTLPTGTATSGTHYTALLLPGSLTFPPGDTLAYPPLNVLQTGTLPDEGRTVVFELQDFGLTNNATVNPTANVHTYTIVPYLPFEWRGAAGVGKNSDNIIWMDADRLSLANNAAIGNLTNFSPRNIDIFQNTANRRPLFRSSGTQLINTRNVIDFNGNESAGSSHFLTIENSSFTNLSGFVQKKAYFFVIRPESIPTSSSTGSFTPSTAHARLIYEQGGAVRGISVYIYNSRIYFHAWNNNNDGANAPWGFNGTINNNTYAVSAQTISQNTPYIVSCIYDGDADEPLVIYVNGQKGTTSPSLNGNSVGWLYAHSGRIGLGAVDNQTVFHFTSSTNMADGSCAFRGQIAEFIKFHEPQLNESRRIIIENYLSAKYNIPLHANTPQVFDLDFADKTGTNPPPTFNEEVAGVGQFSSSTPVDNHFDAQGNSVLRIKNPIIDGEVGFLSWGHDGVDLTDTWPFSYWNSNLPAPVQERAGKVWKIFENPVGSVETADIYINFSASGNAGALSVNPNFLKLIYHDGSEPYDFGSATVRDITSVQSGNVAFFAGVPITDGMYFTLGNTSAIDNIPLPIELASFNARLSNEVVDLNWSTYSESNNDYFVVERTGQNLVWEEVLRKPGAGNSNSLLFYSDIDPKPLNGVSYYRLKQVDFDGSFTYSEIVSVLNTASGTPEEIILFPNPTTSGLSVLRLPDSMIAEPGQIYITDLYGKRVDAINYPAEQSLIALDLSGLDGGVYIISVESTLIKTSLKLVIQ